MTESAIIKRQGARVRFKDADMDFMLNWMVGVSAVAGWGPGVVLNTAAGIADGGGESWRTAFAAEARHLLHRADQYAALGWPTAAAHTRLGAAFAFRASVQYTDPNAPEFQHHVAAMEAALQDGARALDVPIEPIEIPFGQWLLPGYWLHTDAAKRALLVVIGGGDSYREDLFYFAGWPAWQRGYDVLMVDLPGQGKTPSAGMHFSLEAEGQIGAALDWVELRSGRPLGPVAILGLSGGGYLTARAVTADPRIGAWIASTPLVDIGRAFQLGAGALLSAPEWLASLALRIMRRFKSGLRLQLEKYAWQFGTDDFISALRDVIEKAPPVDTSRIRCPSLFLVGDGEAEELKRQARELTHELKVRGVNARLCEFSAPDGADAHCQVNNLRLLHAIMLDWLDDVFAPGPGLAEPFPT